MPTRSIEHVTSRFVFFTTQTYVSDLWNSLIECTRIRIPYTHALALARFRFWNSSIHNPSHSSPDSEFHMCATALHFFCALAPRRWLPLPNFVDTQTDLHNSRFPYSTRCQCTSLLGSLQRKYDKNRGQHRVSNADPTRMRRWTTMRSNRMHCFQLYSSNQVG